MKRGYFGIGIYHPKTTENMGTLWRSAHNFGANFIFTIGQRYRKQPSDTTDAAKHTPLYHFKDWNDFTAHLPYNADLVFIEQSDKSRSITECSHPEKAIYVLGAEDKGIPDELMQGHRVVHIDTPMCLNVAVAGSIIMFDRQTKIATNSATV